MSKMLEFLYLFITRPSQKLSFSSSLYVSEIGKFVLKLWWFELEYTKLINLVYPFDWNEVKKFKFLLKKKIA